MKITLVNKGKTPVAVIGQIAVQPGGSHTMTGLSKVEAAQVMLAGNKEFLVQTEPDPGDKVMYQAVMQTPADPGAGATVLAAIGFDVVDELAAPVLAAVKAGLAVYDDAACTIPSTTAYIDTPTAGTIEKGSGTNACEVTTEAVGGTFRASVHIPVAAAKVVYLKAFAISTTPNILLTPTVHKVTFTP